ncbi:GPI mannosyltransferase 2 [Earliella scabrosa]|nr:GPI mannosyltransferase 2 [Earliella scabrosa]
MSQSAHTPKAGETVIPASLSTYANLYAHEDASSGELGKEPQAAALDNDSHNRRVLLALSCTATALTLVLTVIAAHFPLFDASPHVLLPPLAPDADFFLHLRHTLASAVLRWDAFHFAHVATDGYVYEHEWAFFPGLPHTMSRAGRVIGYIFDLIPSVGPSSSASLENVLLGGFIATTLTSCSVLTLYDLSLIHLRSREAAFLAALLSLLPSSPVTLRVAGYTEPFFTYLSYRAGMLHCARGNWFYAAVAFLTAGAFRSNGIFLCGFLIWGMIVEPLLARRKIHVGALLHAAILCGLSCSPFIYHQYSAYRQFCTHTSSPAPWCNAYPASIYTYVQAKYWNSGFMLYWTVQQLPNFLLGAPPLILLFSFTTHYIRHALLPRLHSLVPMITSRSAHAPTESTHTRPGPPTRSPFLRPSLAPHAIHALALSLLLLFASHTQIVLRLAASMPLTYWAAAWLLVERPRAGRLWVGWSVVWGAVSCVLWGVFLPPA